MYTAQTTINRIQSLIKEKGLTQKSVLLDCGINENTLKRMTDNKGISSFYLAKIADYLDCSVDYLLGSTDTPQVSQNNVIHTGDITGNHNANINSKDNSDTQELLELIKSLPLVKRAVAIILINDLKKKENCYR